MEVRQGYLYVNGEQAEAEKAERQRKAREAAEKRAEKEQQKKAEKNYDYINIDVFSISFILNSS